MKLGLFKNAKTGEYEMAKIDDKMEGTWAGTTDMLERCIDYVLRDPKPEVPVVTMARWNEDRTARFAEIKGKVAAAIPVNLDGKLNDCLYLAAEQGDRLFAWNGKALADGIKSLELKEGVEATINYQRDGGTDVLKEIRLGKGQEKRRKLNADPNASNSGRRPAAAGSARRRKCAAPSPAPPAGQGKGGGKGGGEK